MLGSIVRSSRGGVRRGVSSPRYVRVLSSAAEGVVPVISFEPFRSGDAAARRGVIDQLATACEEIGFFVLVDHGISAEVVDAAWDATEGFFDLSGEDKIVYATEDEAKYPYGYVEMGGEILAAGKDAEDGAETTAKPDLKECFAIGPYNPASGMPAPIWPTSPADFEASWLAYYQAMESLARDLLSAMALALDLEETFFDDKIDRHRSALRALNYPAQDEPPLPGQLRASPHTDYGSVTILKAGAAGNAPTGGLQVMGRDMQWHDVPLIKDGFVINLGDLMSRWTNDKWVSTLHQVVNPPAEYASTSRRQSMAFFHNINADHLVECIETCHDEANPPKYEPIVAFDFLMEKHLASVGGSK